VLLVAAGAGLATAATHSRSSAPETLERTLWSHNLRDRLHFTVTVPAGYDTSTKRYPVVYFLHGLPGSATSYEASGFVRAALSATRRSAILVAPQGARPGETDPEYLDRGPGHNWESALADELPDYIDGHFRTIPTRHGRVLVGLSAGGYGAAAIGLHHLTTYGAIESWSGYFHPTDPTGRVALDLGSTSANRRADLHTFVHSLKRAFRRRPTLLAFYVGDRDDRFRPENLQLHRELSAAGVPHVFRVYHGGHATVLWSAHARAWLDLALGAL